MKRSSADPTDRRSTEREGKCLALAFLCLLSACTVGPDYVKPSAQVPAGFKDVDGWKSAQPRDGVIRGRWWEVFEDPALNALEQRIEISNQNLAAAEAQFRQARALVQIARAGYFPTVTAGPSVARYRNSSNMPINTSAYVGPNSISAMSFDATWEADIWGRMRRLVESSRAAAQASAADLETVRLSTQAELAMDYFQLRGLDADRRLLDETIVAYQKALDLTRSLFKGGAASNADVVQAEAQLKRTQAQAIDVGVQRTQLEDAIAVLVGNPASTFSIPVSPLAATPPPAPVGVPSQLLERRPDIAAAERRVAAANAQIGVALAAFYPTVTLSASGGFEATRLSNWFNWPSRFWSLGPAALTGTLLDGGLRRAQTDQVRAAYDETVAFYRQTVLTSFQNVEDSLAALRILEQEARVQDEAVAAAERSVTLTTDQYKVGIVSYLNVVTAQTFALTDERTAVSIASRRMTASVLLVKALGGGWTVSSLPSNAALMGKGGPGGPIESAPGGQSPAASGDQH
jgi:NodT family efflux transporter outer membrane factor (OMF) lipoprotein